MEQMKHTMKHPYSPEKSKWLVTHTVRTAQGNMLNAASSFRMSAFTLDLLKLGRLKVLTTRRLFLELINGF
jgi:hypothetical protein